MSTIVTSHQKYVRMSPRKLQLVADMVRGQVVSEALTTLSVTPKRAARTIHTVLTQAKANAVNNVNLDERSLHIHRIQVDPGPIYKRWRPVSRGRAHPILKRTSHVTISLSGEPADKHA